MKSFSSEFFKQNRLALRQSIGDESPIILSANGVIQRAGDSGYPFRQDSNFWYLTGLSVPDATLVITQKTEFLILPERDPILDYFEGAIDVDALRKTSGIDQIMSHHEGWEYLRLVIKKSKSVYTCLVKGFDARHSIYINPSKPRLISRLRKLSNDAEIKDVRKSLALLRMVKQSVEIDAIENAIKATIDAFSEIFRDGWYEKYNAEALISTRLGYEFAKRSGEHAYPPIVASGKSACTLHYDKNNQPIGENDLLLVDAGAEVGMYASDITRVYPPKKMSVLQKEIYEAVKDIQSYVISELKPGVDIKEIDKQVEKKIGQFLKLKKLITKQEPAQIRKFYPHAVSHHLGLDVHDVADYSQPLVEGNVITVEPGIYIPEYGIGVRIEDDILITKNGAKNLSADLPS